MMQCRCDGPPHEYDPAWCSRIMPVYEGDKLPAPRELQQVIECRLCGSRFRSPNAVVKHVATMHAGDPLLDGSGGDVVRVVPNRTIGSPE